MSEEEFAEAVRGHLQRERRYSTGKAQELMERYSEIMAKGYNSLSFSVSSTVTALLLLDDETSQTETVRNSAKRKSAKSGARPFQSPLRTSPF